MQLRFGRRARLREERRELRKEARNHWHTVFAWFPRKVGPEDWRWFETVWHRYWFDPDASYPISVWTPPMTAYDLFRKGAWVHAYRSLQDNPYENT